MKLNIHTEAKKKVKYKIYAINDKKKKLVEKGKFKNEVNLSLDNNAEEIIVRVSPCGFFALIFSILYLQVWEMFNFGSNSKNYDHVKYMKDLNYYNEIEIRNCKNIETAEVLYRYTPYIITYPNKRRLPKEKWGPQVEPLVCTNHPYIKKEMEKGRVFLSRMFNLIFFIAVLVGIGSLIKWIVERCIAG
jgi:hypothetical protein